MFEMNGRRWQRPVLKLGGDEMTETRWREPTTPLPSLPTPPPKEGATGGASLHRGNWGHLWAQARGIWVWVQLVERPGSNKGNGTTLNYLYDTAGEMKGGRDPPEGRPCPDGEMGYQHGGLDYLAKRRKGEATTFLP